MKIFYIAGHGAGDPGAVGCNYEEAERVRTFGKRLKELGGDAVELSDFNRDYYKDSGISRLTINPKEYAILEGHMDAGAATARGGHVIINSAYDPDEYDKNLAEMLGEKLPGRSELIVKRNNLLNLNLSAQRGYNYRLVEFGFITNFEDVKIFREEMDDIVYGVLSAFGIVPKIGGEDTMLCFIQKQGGTTQYLFDGWRIKGIPNIPTKLAYEDIISKATGKKPGTYLLTADAFDMICKTCERI